MVLRFQGAQVREVVIPPCGELESGNAIASPVSLEPEYID